ncbi:hypothetical protein [Tautonia marina]|uniref:hypothetical protein n=1 Tax=Tautonia marina TaxID=2653855 RepID=UPI0012606BB3|nr:hypothetical protein [Tautonia marina]
MRDDRRTLGAALLGAALAATGSTSQVRAQDPLPPLPPAVSGSTESISILPSAPVRMEKSAGALEIPPPIVPGTPVPAPIHVHGQGSILGPHAGAGHLHQPGPIARTAHHIGYTIKDRMIGEHERFAEPPLGWSVNRNFGAQQARAEIHRFTLYRTDFQSGSEQLNPGGLRRLGRMVSLLHCYNGPLLVEIDPNRPGLAEARRLAVLELAASNGTMLDPDRLIVGGSPFLGGRGDLSEIYNGVVLDRSLRAPETYPVPPLPNADFQN